MRAARTAWPLLLALAIAACGGGGPGDGDAAEAPAAPAETPAEEDTAATAPGSDDGGLPPGFEDLAPEEDTAGDELLDGEIGQDLNEDATEADGGAAEDGGPPAPETLSAVWVQLVDTAEPPPAGVAGRGGRGGDRRAGEEFGCGDRLVALEVPVEAEVASVEDRVRVALETLLGLEPGDVPSDLMTALRRSPMRVEAVSPVPATPGAYRLELGGPLRLGGTCDAPRVRAQLVETARAVEGVDEVEVYVGGEPLDAVLSSRG